MRLTGMKKFQTEIVKRTKRLNRTKEYQKEIECE